MPDEFDTFNVHKKETFKWETTTAGTEQVVTTRGTYIIRQKHKLSYVPVGGGVEQKLGWFANAKDRARRHFTNEA